MGGKLFLSLRSRLLLLVLLAVLPALALLILTAADQRAQISYQARTEALRLAAVAASQHERSVESSQQFLTLLTRLPELTPSDRDRCDATLAELREVSLSFANLAFISPDGQVVCSALDVPADFSASEQLWFQRARRTGALVTGEYAIGAISGRPVLSMAAPVRDEAGQITGFIFGSLDLTWLSTIPATTQLPERASVTVLSRQGEILLRTPAIEGQRELPADALTTLMARERSGTTEGIGPDGVSRLYGFVPLAPTDDGAVLAIGIPADVAYADATRALERNLLAFAGVVVTAALASWYGGERLLLRYLRPLVVASRRLGEGTLTARTGLPHQGHGELSALAAAFDQMAETVEQRDAEIRRAAEERLAVERRLQRSQRLESLGVLAGGIAHDFNNLLAIIRGNVSLALIETPRDHSLRELLEPIDQSARRAAELTRQMVAYAGQGRLVVEELDLARLVAGAHEILRASLPERVELRVDVAPDLPALAADASQLQELVINLVQNAGEAMHEGGVVSLSASVVAADQAPRGECVLASGRAHARSVVLEVADQGAGIAPEDVGRIFEPFYTTKFVGRGLGLAAVAGIVRAHGGAVYIESALGVGTAVRVLLPAIEPAAEALPAAAAQV